MARDPLLVGLDVGTSSVRALLYDARGRVRAAASCRQRTWGPHPGWVEQDAEELFRLSLRALRRVLAHRTNVVGLGITNQRESLVAADARTGRPLAPVIGWQDTRTEALARELAARGWGDRVWDQGGLPLTTYPTAPKMLWSLRNDRRVRGAAARDRLLLGTVDSWVLFRLMGGARRGAPWLTDPSNASRTLLYDLGTGNWSPSLLEHFQVPRETLAQLRPSFGAVYGEVAPELGLARELPVAADLGDQQASLFGLGGLSRGTAKLTFGTGAFFLAEGAPPGSGRAQGLIRTVLYGDEAGRRAFGLEGGVGAAGSFLEWLCIGGLGLFSGPSALERAARAAGPGHGLSFVPALGGLFAPHWRPASRGSLIGLTSSTSRSDLARAALEGVAHRVTDILDSYRKAVGRAPPVVWTDGGLSRSDLLLQLVADLSGFPLARSPVIEATSRGVALAAGVSLGLFASPSALPHPGLLGTRVLRPRMARRIREAQRSRWGEAVRGLE